jgi:3-oxoacyl-[acyl-carrier-protein] synthase-1
VIPLAIRAMGAVTAVGDNLPLTVAAIYTHAQRFETLGEAGADGQRVVGARAPIGADLMGIDRLRGLALLALRECAAHLGETRVPLVICAPPLVAFGHDASWFLRQVIADSQLPIDLDASQVIEGRGSHVRGLAIAARLVSSESWPACLLLAVDSLITAARVARDLAAGRIAGDNNPTGFVPGEAGAALLLSARGVDASATAVIGGVADVMGGPAFETGAAVLAEAADRALAGVRLSGAALGAICHDGSGDWAQLEELALADGRPPLSVAPHAQRFLPAISTGDVGAASGVLSIALLAFLISKGVIRRPALALSSTDGPARAAVVLMPAAADAAGRTRGRRRGSPVMNDGWAAEPDLDDLPLPAALSAGWWLLPTTGSDKNPR